MTIDSPSPNFDSRNGQAIDMLVLHYTGMPSAPEALRRMRDPATQVSAHYMVDEDGTIRQLVAEAMRAWHAGISHWRGQTNINQRSIGIEIVNPGHEFGYRAFPQAQMEAVAALCKSILARHSIPPRNVVAHSDVAPTRKEDPGELFNWPWLAEQGVGLFPPPAGGRVRVGASPLVQNVGPAPTQPSPLQGEGFLAAYGYDITDLPKAILAFQRHFRPALLNGLWDDECARRLESLLDSAL